jgi:predicted ABC-type ATPase
MDWHALDQRPVVVAVAGPNGAGKTTFYHAHLEALGLSFVNADMLSRELNVGAYEAAQLAGAVREEVVRRGESFVFETVLSDPVGEKVAFLESLTGRGYLVVMCYIGISGPETSIQRVAMRVSQGDHDVPDEKLYARFPRTLANLGRAIRRLPYVLVYDNDDLARPFRQVAVFVEGELQLLEEPVPKWLERFVIGPAQ